MKKVIIFMSTILLTISIVGCNYNEILGNTNDDILQYLYDSDLLNNIGKNNLTIIDTIYVDHSKIVGFLSDNGQGVIVYEENERGDYIMIDAQAQSTLDNNLGVTTYRIRYNSNDDFGDKAYVVISQGGIVSSVRISINNNTYSDLIDVNNPSIIMFKENLLENELKEMITVNYNFFDIYNNELQFE